MKTIHFLVLAALTTCMGLAAPPASAQQVTPRWKPGLESVIISAKRPDRNYRLVLSNSRIGEAMFVSASIEVPYSDLNLVKDPDAEELDRRIGVAARVVCNEMDRKYPPSLFPILEGFDCVSDAARDGRERANQVIAKARQ
jgi:UrcA family protein